MGAAIRATVVGAATADAVVRPVELTFPNRHHYWWRFPFRQKYQPQEGADFGNAAEADMRANSKVTVEMQCWKCMRRGRIAEADVLRSGGRARVDCVLI
jgi:hypothetical protein